MDKGIDLKLCGHPESVQIFSGTDEGSDNGRNSEAVLRVHHD